MFAFVKKRINWILPAVLILFLLEILMLPVVIYFTYAGSSDSPNHILHYSDNRLLWEKVKGIDDKGVARLSFFEAAGQSYNSDNEDVLVLPGEDILKTIRLYNETAEKVTYTALIYKITSDPDLPVIASMDSAFSKTAETYPLPENVPKDAVITALTGDIPAHGRQDFDVRWSWEYFNSELQDILDTRLGDKAAFSEADTIQIGFYVVIESDGENIDPETPPTGDSFSGIYAVLMVISGILLVVLIVSTIKESKKRSEDSLQ